MLVLGALCVLLPLVVALDRCNTTKAANFLAENRIHGNLLRYFEEQRFWAVAVSAEGAGTSQSVDIRFFKIIDNKVPAEFVFRNSTGATILNGFYTLDGDHIIVTSKKTNSAAYFFQCSKNIIASYRCQDKGTSGGSGPKYFVWAAWDKCEADVDGELESCLATITKEDPSATFLRRTHP